MFMRLRQMLIPGLFDEDMDLRSKHMDIEGLDVEEV
jgi:hypothetical protein